MPQSETELTLFQTRVRQMILRFNELKKENRELYAMMEEQDRLVTELRNTIREKDREYEALKSARMFTVADGDVEATKEKLAALIRSVNKCIDMLSDEK